MLVHTLKLWNLETLKPASRYFSRPGRQDVQQFTDGQSRLQEHNHLIRADSCFFAQGHNLGDRTLQAFFLSQGEWFGWIGAHGWGRMQFCSHSDTPFIVPTCGYDPLFQPAGAVMRLTSICDGPGGP